ncbi:hypothetical protein ACTFIZ_012709 [Dictyostelium cf. discoideum]
MAGVTNKQQATSNKQQATSNKQQQQQQQQQQPTTTNQPTNQPTTCRGNCSTPPSTTGNLSTQSSKIISPPYYMSQRSHGYVMFDSTVPSQAIPLSGATSGGLLDNHQQQHLKVDFYVVQLNQLNKQFVVYWVQFQPLELVYLVVETSLFGNTAIPNTKQHHHLLGCFGSTAPSSFSCGTSDDN